MAVKTNEGLERAVDRIKQYNAATENMNELYSRDIIPLFIYGTERHKFSYHHLLKGAPRIGLGWTVVPTFRMFKVEERALGWVYPVIMKRGGEASTARVFGEVYLVTPDLLQELDQMYALGPQKVWKREPELIRYYDIRKKGDKEKTFYIARCDCYVGQGRYWDELFMNEEATVVQPYSRSGSDELTQYLSFMWGDDAPNREQ